MDDNIEKLREERDRLKAAIDRHRASVRPSRRREADDQLYVEAAGVPWDRQAEVLLRRYEDYFSSPY